MRPNMTLRLLPFAMLFLILPGLHAQLTVIDIPNATNVHVTSINNAGEVVGYFCEGAGSSCFPFDPTQRGFVRQSNGEIVTFDGIPMGINDAGSVAGYMLGSGEEWIRAFSRDKKGNVAAFAIQPLPPDPAATFGIAINNRGDVAGYVIPCPICDNYRAFVRDKKGQTSTFTAERGLMAVSINARGDVTGRTSPYYVSELGFIADRKGNLSLFEVPDGSPSPGPEAFPVSINNAGDVTGYFDDTHDLENRRTRSFVRFHDGSFAIFDASADAWATRSSAINEQGDVAGGFATPTGRGLFLRGQAGELTVFNIPDSLGAEISALNNRGDVAGSYTDETNVTHGFIWTAP